MTALLHMCLNPNQHYVVGATARHPGGTYVLLHGRWRHWGADDPSLTSVAFDPVDVDTVYTSGQNGLWRSLDAGASWRVMNDWRVTDARAVALDTRQPGTVYLALPDGIVSSTDHGRTWERREGGLPIHGRYTQTVVADRARAGHVVAACERGLAVSTDSGRRWWVRIETRATVTQVAQGHEPSTWFATTERDGVWRSTDGARSWHRLKLPRHTGTLYDVVVDPDVPGAVAVVDHDHGLWWSEDDGETWHGLTAHLPGPLRAHRLGIDPQTGHLLLATYGRGLLLSLDRGQTWVDGGWPGSEVRSFAIGEMR